MTIGIFKKNGAPIALYNRGTSGANALEVLTSGIESDAAYFDVLHYSAQLHAHADHAGTHGPPLHLRALGPVGFDDPFHVRDRVFLRIADDLHR